MGKHETKKVDEERLKKLWSKGKEAWRNIPSPTEWVERLRGNKKGQT